MKLTSQALVSFSAAFAAGLLGCRATAGLVGNEYADPQAKMEWIARPELDLPRSDHPTVFIRPFKDAVGAGLDLTDQIRQAVVGAGYEISDSRDADFQLVATLRHFDKAKSFDGGESAMKAVQAVAPIVGTIGGAYAGSGAGTVGIIGGAVAGGIMGSVASAAMENFSKVYEWDLILDIELNERVEGGFIETRSRDESATSGSNAVHGGESGGRTTNDHRQAEITKEQSHLRNTFRLVACAYQMRMTREEALSSLLPRLPNSVSSVMP
ncbi:MAG: hypothetical protein HOP15_06190 [Planctomycetes bacterium]|nr:hypothetical protein [Planctomycetota bacterium]